jgi:hypothetical protein
MFHGGVGEALPGALHDRLDLSLGHALADLPMDDEPDVAVEEASDVKVQYRC